MQNNPEIYMEEALKEAQLAFDANETPVGCVIVKDEKIIARAHNLRETLQQSLAHAEVLAIKQACEVLHSWRLDECTLVVTIEPCPMCAGAIQQARIPEVIYGAPNQKGGCFGTCWDFNTIPNLNHYVTVRAGVMNEECGALMSAYFKQKRMKEYIPGK